MIDFLPLEGRIERDPNSGCWLWAGALSASGYAIVRRSGKEVRLSRAALGNRLGSPLPPELLACHKCDTPACINPDHLFPGTYKDNAADMARKGRASRQGAPAGTANPNSRLTDALVVEILTSPESSRKIASRMGVTDCMIRRIRRRIAWRHVSIPSRGVGA